MVGFALVFKTRGTPDSPKSLQALELTWWTFRIFFCLLGGGEGESEVPERPRCPVFIENPRRGVSQERGGGSRAGRVSAGIWRGGGGVNIYFRGRNSQQVYL